VAHWNAARAPGQLVDSHAARRRDLVFLSATHLAPGAFPLLDAHCWRGRSSAWRPRYRDSPRSPDDHFGQRSCSLEMHCPGDPRDGPLDDPRDARIPGGSRLRLEPPLPRAREIHRVGRWPPRLAARDSRMQIAHGCCLRRARAAFDR
jgi:hypothetical protein